jgi:hypothetical protein
MYKKFLITRVAYTCFNMRGVVFLLLSFTVGCSSFLAQRSEWQTPDLVTLNNLHVVQVDARQIRDTCGGGGGCYNKQLNRIVIPRFTGEHDPVTTCALGEEVRHAMGMEH